MALRFNGWCPRRRIYYPRGTCFPITPPIPTPLSSFASISFSLQEIPIRFRQLLIIIPLESQPALFISTDRRIRELGLLVTDENLLVPGSCTGRIREQLSVARLVEANEPKRRGVDRLRDGQQAVILQDDRLAVPERLGDAFALLAVQHHAAEVVIDGVRLPEPQCVLRHHVQLAPKHAERLPVHRVCVACRVHVGPCFVDLRVYRERRRVDGLVSDHHFAVFIHEDQVRHADLAEVLRQWVEPWNE